MLLLSLFVIVHSTELTILKPSLLTPHGNNTIPVNVADFGYVPYGKTVSGEMIFINDTCNPLNTTTLGKVVLTEGMNCTFLAQAMNVQKAGGKMLVIIYNGKENISNFLLIADHSSQQVFIPSMMINGQDGDWLIEQLNQISITVSVEFLLHQNETVHLDYYMSSLDNQSYAFLKQFQPFAKQMINQIEFAPTYVQYYCLDCQQQNFTVTREDCISGGRYCAFDPDGPLTGRDVIMQDLTQLCILKEYDILKWWNYAVVYSTMCLAEKQECSGKIMQLISINETRIQNCINTSFVGNDHLMDDNTILAAQRVAVIKAQAIYWPVLYINGDFFKGDLFMVNVTDDDIFTVDQFAVLEAICDAFQDSSRPTLCKSSGFFTMNDGELKQAESNWVMIAVWISVSVLILFLLFVSFLLYRRKLLKTVRGDVNVQVDTLLNEYYKMKDAK